MDFTFTPTTQPTTNPPNPPLTSQTPLMDPDLRHRISTDNTLHTHHLSRLAQTHQQEYAHRHRLLQLEHSFKQQAQTAFHNQELQYRRGVLEQQHDLDLAAQSALQTQEFLHRRRVLMEEIALRAGEKEKELEQRWKMGELERDWGGMGIDGGGKAM
ncbi:MAG: hypothetical protein Q9161_004287 [Pseudevernia consocians]